MGDSTDAAAKLVPRVPVREHAPRDFLRHGEWQQYARAGLRAREVNVKVTKHMRSYLSPESLAVCRQLNSEWLRDIEDELRESRAALRAREDTPSASAV